MSTFKGPSGSRERNMKKLSLRHPSVLSPPSVPDEDRSPSVPYAAGPVQILPRIWLGSADNARDTPALRARGIHAVLNVAKEVPPPPRPDNYLKLSWSHAQPDLLADGFPAAMAFVDAALHRGHAVLIHCQCGVSRSATLVIALVMRAAATRSPDVPPDVWDLKGMQAAYAYVKGRSRHVGPNLFLIYQLQDYEKALQGATSPLSDHVSSLSEEDKEWGRRRNAFAQEHPDPVHQEAIALDRAMQARIDARKRTGSVASVLSEDLVDADEESDLLGTGGPFHDALDLRRSPSLSSDSPGSPSDTQTLSVHPRVSFSLPPPKPSFKLARPPPSTFKTPPGKGKRRSLPPTTLPPVPPSPVTPIAVQESPRRRKPLARKYVPPPLTLQAEANTVAFPTNSKNPLSALPAQTLFVFPPSPTVRPATAMRTPSTVTLMSMDKNTFPFPSQSTPRVATSRAHGRTRSFIGLGASVAPTTAYSRVDARGWVGLDKVPPPKQ